jgi:hypothetical protein
MEIFKPVEKKIMGTVIVTHNRLDLTKITIESYLNTRSLPSVLFVVDNKSDDKMVDYLHTITEIDELIIMPQNRYPGAALNCGWDLIAYDYPNIKFLHRSDNDIFYRCGWDIYVNELMDLFPKLGQFGLLDLTDHHFFGTVPTILRERSGFKFNGHAFPVGGAYVIRREIWDQKIKHHENSWNSEAEAEDKYFTDKIRENGWLIGHAMEPLVSHLGIGYGFDPRNQNYSYYEKSFKDRGVSNFESFLYDNRLKRFEENR